MNAKDFSDEHDPTRGQYEQIARQFARICGEPFPSTRVEATELLLRLSETPDPTESTGEAPASRENERQAPQAVRPQAGRTGHRLVVGRGSA